MKLKNKKAYFFTLDAIIALLLMFSLILFIKPVSKVSAPEVRLHHDVLDVLSDITVKEYYLSKQEDIPTGYTQENTLLEQLVELYSLGNTKGARNRASEIFSGLKYTENIGLCFGDTDE
jgi:hypothetical protein